MQLTHGSLGNGITILNTYNNIGLPTNLHNYNSNTNILNVSYTYNVARGLTLSRNNYVANYNETFTYDNNERLLSWSNPSGTESHEYTTDGRISTSTEVGTYNYQNASRYNLQNLTLNYHGNQRNISHQTLSASYNMFKDPVTISENTYINFYYNLKNERSSAYYGYAGYAKTKHYSEGQQVEVIITNQTNNIYNYKFITYLDGDPYSANIVYIKEYNSSAASINFEGFYYLHRDNQGSILAITNQLGNVVESRVFDPWGNLKQGSINLIEHGYTGHEHFLEISIIHMNARIYDPFTKMFLQPDNIIQDNTKPDNYNRYGYCLNNPLKYTDPSGNVPIAPVFLAIIIGASVSSTVYLIQAAFNNSFSWEGLGIAAFQGAISGAASFGIGVAFGTTGKFMHEFARALAHGYSQATISGVFGSDVSNFGSSFAAGAVSSLVGSGLQAAGLKGLPLLYFGGALSGGLAAAITGGDFLEGAATGLIVTALNHGFREAFDNLTSQGQQKQNQQKTEEQIKENNCKTCIDDKTKNKNLFGSNYVGPNNPKNNDKTDNYSVTPINQSDANAKEHDIRYDKMKTKGFTGLITETRAIGADYDFVLKQFEAALNPLNNSFKNAATGLISGYALGLFALPKTIIQLIQPNGFMKIYINYHIYK